MSAEVHVRVPDEVNIDALLRTATDHYGYECTVLAAPERDDAVSAPSPRQRRWLMPLSSSISASTASGIFRERTGCSKCGRPA